MKDTEQMITVMYGKPGKMKSSAITIDKAAKVKDLKKAFAKMSKKDVNRVSFKTSDGKVRLDDDSKLITSYELKDATVNFKDLGAQIGYRTVFLWEYFGPMVFVGLYYYLRPALIYSGDVKTEYNWVANLGVACWMIHFLKREFETLFIHKFSRPTMPLSNLFKNCTYYWTFGAVIGYPLCSPSFVPPSLTQVYVGLGIFAACELGNLICHIMLSNMRPAEGSQKRLIPSGFLFDLVACPNYTFEVMSWVGFSIMTQLPFAYLFTLVGFLQMADWAMKKHKGYKKVYDKEYTDLRRKAIIPFLY
eukprot:CAMPEP_0173178524 /NCGR_PEP_ID=MMETSP1141-20130122/5588_1 /TAXON_ID=483371 /ORGANISM="non described non described, Strain CCMP2298" /LENGTH=303 /DNA_ID=CAMNT_0014101033 /DNA_START=67 /DNA_END=978 /DNA_ORIENTATION=+